VKFKLPENGPAEILSSVIVARFPVLVTFALFNSSADEKCRTGPFLSVLGLSKKMYLMPGR
jgi:hypothetical protein